MLARAAFMALRKLFHKTSMIDELPSDALVMESVLACQELYWAPVSSCRRVYHSLASVQDMHQGTGSYNSYCYKHNVPDERKNKKKSTRTVPVTAKEF